MGALVVILVVLCVRLVRVYPHAPVDTLNCVNIRGDRWNLLPGIEYTGRIKIQLPPRADAGMTLVVGDSLPVVVEAESLDGARVPLPIDAVNPNDAPIDFWLEYGSPWQAPRHVVKAALAARDDRPQAVIVSLGRRGPRVLARLVGYPEDARGRICAASIAAPSAFASARDLEIVPAQIAYFAGGWYGLDTQSPVGIVRWMGDHGAMLVPSTRDGMVRARLQAVSLAAAEGEAPAVTLKVNDVFEAPGQTMKAGASIYEWVIPSSAWVAGTNELLFKVSRTTQIATDRRPLGLAVQKVTLTLMEQSGVSR